MANRNAHDLQHLSREVKIVSGIISVVGAASAANNVVSLVSSDYTNGIASVARTGVGEITITLQDSWVACLGVLATLQPESDAERVIKILSHDVVSAKTVVLVALDESLLPEDVPNTETDYIHFMLLLKNSTVK